MLRDWVEWLSTSSWGTLYLCQDRWFTQLPLPKHKSSTFKKLLHFKLELDSFINAICSILAIVHVEVIHDSLGSERILLRWSMAFCLIAMIMQKAKLKCPTWASSSCNPWEAGESLPSTQTNASHIDVWVGAPLCTSYWRSLSEQPDDVKSVV